MITKTLPRGFTTRPSTMDDVAAVTGLARMGEIAQYGEAETTLDDTRRYYQMPGVNPATDSQVVLSPAGQIVGLISVTHQEHAHIYANGDVHEEYLGRGIGTYLMQWAEERARQHIAEAAPGVRVTLDVSQGSLNAAARQLYERLGFTLIRHFWRMGIELHEAPPTAQWPEGVTLRTMAPGMERAVFDADQDAFKDHWGFMPGKFDEWEHWTVKRENFDPSLWFLAMDGDEIAAFSVCADEKESGGWVHDLGVRRPWRRKGLGLALLYHSFAEFYRRGIHNVYLGVDAASLTGATRLYERAGMHVTRQFDRYEKELRAGKELSTQSVEG